MINIIIGEICNKTIKKKKWAEILDNECVTLLILKKKRYVLWKDNRHKDCEFLIKLMLVQSKTKNEHN